MVDGAYLSLRSAGCGESGSAQALRVGGGERGERLTDQGGGSAGALKRAGKHEQSTGSEAGEVMEAKKRNGMQAEDEV
jgi:hypothetical protein